MKNDYIGILWMIMAVLTSLFGKWILTIFFIIMFYGENTLNKLDIIIRKINGN